MDCAMPPALLSHFLTSQMHRRLLFDSLKHPASDTLVQHIQHPLLPRPLHHLAPSLGSSLVSTPANHVSYHTYLAALSSAIANLLRLCCRSRLM
ncbi:hypothetical protein BDW22DRAFT_1100151 [Trametopsis cervina]|nr:hypothetical protein BDW22DRAFT_1100151 [Trametopsis cervina]